MTKTDEVLVYGELLWDILPDKQLLGGAPANCAFRLTQEGFPVHLVTALGRDKLGSAALSLLQEAGLDCSYIQCRQDLPTGTVAVTVDENGSPDYVIHRDVAYDQIQITPELIDLAKRSRMLIFGSLVQRSPESHATLLALTAAAPNAVKVLDVNLRKDCFSSEILASSLKIADLLKLNDDEVSAISEIFKLGSASVPDFCTKIIRDYDLKVCLVTLGKKGAIAVSATGELIYTPGHNIQVADTIGAGDAFTAGFAAKYLQGAPLLDCCEYANVMGALAATRTGGMSKIEKEEISQCLLAASPSNYESIDIPPFEARPLQYNPDLQERGPGLKR
jgi:fructokinase